MGHNPIAFHRHEMQTLAFIRKLRAAIFPLPMLALHLW